ncbi:MULTISPECIES: tRNA pseudouridine(38-40) synthase TruA [Haloferax]|uniref:tRNA pseudouridine synthase A n=1 Tax=Haloferax marinum TaxID=2666143 RepID=A0A6A8G6X2_9EURY|nr:MULTISPECIES: tRNA pseudouridine(38-40) synthase TruA [Haloferax]KAB1197954.1 tRNA pseudouridine(38-40) synthase TruA [Haloferax sp. CBA1150]MRW97020.1 tRNA pseudouridine(38-40) synthase TruA [Haloferax marinum]
MRVFRIAYDGRPYYGFQRQPDVPTVEDAILDACRALGVCESNAVPTGYAAAGRTDAGVSALAQTVAFECPDWCTPRALNSELPGTVRAWAAADVPDDFHARHQPNRREYVYDLYAPVESFDDERAAEAFDTLRGEHDFHNLTPDDYNTVRTIDGDLTRDGDFLLVRVEAGGFARELVRRLVSLLQVVGSGSAPMSKVADVLGAEHLKGPDGVPPARPTPLVLTAVEYPGVEFDVDPDAAESAVEVFTERALADRIGWRVGTRIRDGIDGAE